MSMNFKIVSRQNPSKEIPYIVLVTPNENTVTLMVNESDVQASSIQQIKENKSEIINLVSEDTGELHATAVPYLQSYVVRLISFGKTDEIVGDTATECLALFNEMQAKKQEMQQHYKEMGVTCPACEEGKLNRIYLYKYVKLLYTQEEIDILADVINFNYNTQYVFKTEFIKSYYNKFMEEIHSQSKNGGGCPNCKKNAIRLKYTNIILNQIKNENKS